MKHDQAQQDRTESDLHLQEIACPLCGGERRQERIPEHIVDPERGFDFFAEHGGHFRINGCLDCGFVYSSPVFDSQTFQRLYDCAETDACLSETSERGIAVNMRRYMNRLMKHSGIRSGRFLDVGCGCGQMISAALEAGFEAHGIDPSSDAVEAASAGGAQVKHGAYQEDSFPPGQFDLISVIHVIDHVMSPLELMRNVRRHLRPGGAVLVATHNIESLLAKLTGDSFLAYNIQHISYFTPKTLGEMMRRAGLEPVAHLRSLTSYSLRHLAENGLGNPRLRGAALKVLSGLRLGGRMLTFPFGNIEVVAVKPGEAAASSDR